MSVEFNDEQQKASLLYARFHSSNEEPALVKWLIKIGVVKSSKQANMILVAMMIICLALAIIIVSKYAGRI